MNKVIENQIRRERLSRLEKLRAIFHKATGRTHKAFLLREMGVLENQIRVRRMS